jgi:hypothetical protein
MKAKKRYWWASFAVYFADSQAWSFREMVMTKHPFEFPSDNWGTENMSTLINYREIPRAEYELHPEHVTREETGR